MFQQSRSHVHKLARAIYVSTYQEAFIDDSLCHCILSNQQFVADVETPLKNFFLQGIYCWSEDCAFDVIKMYIYRLVLCDEVI